MSEVDDLMVDVMMRAEDEAENAVIRLIQLVENGEVTPLQNRHLMKAIERRMEKVSSGTDLQDFLLRLSRLINSPKQSELTDNNFGTSDAE
ncbi:MAG: hypothetical protein Q9P01_17655 [Anaerolineae bacterium]|nr:hypothetical protein [Anaerolineae bacterium]MDQ7036583.1 hypothetical protein [Anaerolineae bacterium]